MTYQKVSAEEVASSGLDDWRFVLGAIHADFRAGSFPAAAALVSAIAEAAEEAGHHPDVDIRYPDRVRVTLMTHATGGLTSLDVDLASTISALAATAGADSEPASAQRVEIAIDTMDPDRIRPFWAAVLGYDDVGGYLVDPLRSEPPVWFQVMDEPRTDRDRFHLDVSVTPDEAPVRIEATIAAGGTLVSQEHAPAWWIMADPDGNEACICTWQGRSS